MFSLSTSRALVSRAAAPARQQAAAFSACARVYPNEPSIQILTGFPAPSTLAYKEKVDSRLGHVEIHFPVDLKASYGNFVQDSDGNRMLDVFCSIGTNAVGYNHPRMLEAASSDRMVQRVATRSGVGINPVKDQHQLN